MKLLAAAAVFMFSTIAFAQLGAFVCTPSEQKCEPKKDGTCMFPCPAVQVGDDDWIDISANDDDVSAKEYCSRFGLGFVKVEKAAHSDGIRVAFLKPGGGTRVQENTNQNDAVAVSLVCRASDVLGHWSGTGNSLNDADWNKPCSNITMDIKTDDESLTIGPGSIGCGNIYLDVEPYTLQVRNNQLIHDGKSVGTISASDIHFKMESPRNTWSWSAHVNQDGTLDYFDRSDYRDGHFWEVTGKLSKLR